MPAMELPECCPPHIPFNWKRLGGLVLVILTTYIVLQKTGLARFSPSVGAAVGFGSILLIGFASTLSSCGALVTGLVAASAKPTRFHVRFHAGRIIAFAGAGSLLGFVGRSLAISPAVSGALMVVVAVVMLGYGFKLIGLLPARFPSFKPPAFLASLTERPALLGAATFFLPCGFTQSMQLLAASTGDPWQGALIMALFALGSMPPLMVVGIAAASGKKRSQRISTVAGVLIATLGLLSLHNGVTLLAVLPDASASSMPVVAIIVDDEQFIQMEATEYGTYEPSAFTLKAGVPVRWQIYGSEYMGCLSSFIYREGAIVALLKPGLNEISFTPKRSGRFMFSCSMGMARGTITVE